jgi:ATP phosphoribosyltransferase regulatory subunit
VIDPIPPGTRDIMPAEMQELRRLERNLAASFERFGYGEVSTPTIEYHDVLARGDAKGAETAYRFFDESGELLAMRSDMTIPIARLVASRLMTAEPPFRFFYVGNAYRAVRPQRGQMREFTQAGVELIGADAPDGTAEVIEVLVAALDTAELSRAVIGLGDADLYRQLLADVGVENGVKDEILDRLAAHDLVGIEEAVAALDRVADRDRETLLRLPTLRGGPEVVETARALGGNAVDRATSRMQATFEALAERGVADRVQLDLGLLRDLDYYTGAILEVYDPALGHILGGGGRYDKLMGRFGRSLPAAGFALYLERVHIAQAEEERLGEQERREGT